MKADAQAMSSGRSSNKIAVFDPAARVFAFPKDPWKLTGEISKKLGTQEERLATFKSFDGRPPESIQVINIAQVGSLAVAKLKISTPADGTAFFLAAYRAQGCQIVDLWHIARADNDDGLDRTATIRQLIDTNNAGDVQAFLELSSDEVLHFRNTGDPHAIGDKPSKRNGDPVGRRKAFTEMFKSGAPALVQAVSLFAVGDLVVSQDVARLRDGRILDEISIYRIKDGKIVHDWLIAEQVRPNGSGGGT